MKVKLTLAAALLATFACIPASAQSYQRVSECGNAAPPAGGSPGTQDTTGRLCSQSLSVVASPTTNASATVTTGGTFQQAAAASTARRSMSFVNICNVAGNCGALSNMCYIFFGPAGSATTANSIPVPPGAEYLRSQGAIPSDVIAVTCASTGDKFRLAVQ